MSSISDLPVYDPFRKQNIGRRTGKVISLKNGPITSVEDFFSDSESEVTLNITRQTPNEAKPTTKDSNSAGTENDSSHVISSKPFSEDGLRNPKKISSLKQNQNHDTRIPGVFDPFASSQYGRRTGKDVFSGRKKLLQSNGVGNVSDFFTDSDASLTLNPTPKTSPAVDSLLSSHKEREDPSSIESATRDKRKILQKSSARKSSLLKSESSLKHAEKENTFLQDEHIDERLNKSSRKSLSSPHESEALSNDMVQNLGHAVPKSSSEMEERESIDPSFSNMSTHKQNSSTIGEKDQSNTKVEDPEDSPQNEHQSENVDEGMEETVGDKSLPLDKDITCESGRSNKDEKIPKPLEQIHVDTQKELEDANAHPDLCDFKVPLPKGQKKTQPEVLTDLVVNNKSCRNETDNEDPLPINQETNGRKSKASTPSHMQQVSDLDFGGDAIGSVSQVDKLTGKQFFGIRKRLTFSKAVPEQSVQESKKNLEVFPDVCDGNMKEDNDMCDDFEIVDNDEIVTFASVSSGAKCGQGFMKEKKPKSCARKSTIRSHQKNEVRDDSVNQTITNQQQEIVLSKDDSRSSVDGKSRPRRGSQSSAKQDAVNSHLIHENQMDIIEDQKAPFIENVNENGKGSEKEQDLPEGKNPTPLKGQSEDNLDTGSSEEGTVPKVMTRKIGQRKAKVGKTTAQAGASRQERNCKIPRSKYHKNTTVKDLSHEQDCNEKESLNVNETQKLEISNSSDTKQESRYLHNLSNTSRERVNESVTERKNESSDSGQETQISGSCHVSLVSKKKRNSAPIGELNSGEKSPKYSKRLRRQTQPVQYPVAEIRMKSEKSSSKGSAQSMSEAKETPEEVLIKPPKKVSADQQKKLSKQSSGKRKTNKKIQKDTHQSTPLHQLQPLSMLPRLTPKSGVSFRSRSSCFGLNPHGDNDETDKRELPEKEPLVNSDEISTNDDCVDNAEICEYRSPVFHKPASTIRTQQPLLRKKAIMNNIKGKKIKNVEIVDLNPRVFEQDSENSTVLPSPSSSPVHYQETTISNRRSSVLQVPDFSDRIVHPETSEEGLRRSKRTKVKRLNRAIGEGIVYRRDSTGFGWLVDSVKASQGAIEFLRKEKERQRKKSKRKFAIKTVPAKTKRLSSHCKVQEALSESTEIPVVNPETNETVNIELFSHSSSDKWFGPDLNPVTTMDPIAVCLRLNQPIFGTGELHMKPFSEKQEQLAVYTLIFFITSGKINVTVNNKSSVAQAGDDFFIPRGSWYSLQNLRKDIAKIRFLNLKDDDLKSHAVF